MNRFFRRCCTSVLFAVLLLGNGLALAEEGGGAGTVSYVELKPSFVTNFGYSSSGRLRHMRADIELRLDNSALESQVMYHSPLLRNEILLLLGQQDEVSLSTSDGRRRLQQEALQAVQAALKKEEGDTLVAGLVFTNFFVQH